MSRLRDLYSKGLLQEGSGEGTITIGEHCDHKVCKQLKGQVQKSFSVIEKSEGGEEEPMGKGDEVARLDLVQRMFDPEVNLSLSS